jgi:7-cyano-7-deazaguanine reductase
MNDIPLGKPTTYSSSYAPELLFPIKRSLSRECLGIDGPLPFSGGDVWNAYELSWLNRHGMPQVVCAEFIFPCDCDAIVESKSFKLYLNSFNQSQFDSADDVRGLLLKDLSSCVGCEIEVNFHHVEDSLINDKALLKGQCIDQLDTVIEHYHPAPEVLVVDDDVIEEQLYSHLLRSLCPVTGQPDWATVIVSYKGPKIQPISLLKYIVSYREHQDFHEQCVERMYCDLLKYCRPEVLSVYARYVRRGGLDINPYRSSTKARVENIRLNRQ